MRNLPERGRSAENSAPSTKAGGKTKTEKMEKAMNKTEKMTKEQLLQYVARLQQAAAQAEAAAAAAEQRAEQAEAAAAAAAKAKRGSNSAAPKTHAELLQSDPAYMAGAIWHHVQHLALSAAEEGALNALVTHALKGGKLMSAGASRQNLSRARRAVTGYLAEQRQAEAENAVFDCLYCVPSLTVTPEGDYKGFDNVLAKSPRRLAEALATAETKLAAASSLLAAATTDKDRAAADKALAEAKEAAETKRAQYDSAKKEFTSWLAAQKAAIAAATTDKDKAAIAEGKDKAENA
jgi:hypothetical protein